MSRARTNANNWAADITAVTAGTGITVTNGTGPTPTVAVDTAVIQARVAGVSDTEISYLDGVTSAIQTQLDGKVDANNGTFTAIGGSEGGQINLAAAPTGGTGSVATIDVFQTSLRLTPNNFTTSVRLGSDYANNGSNNIRNITISTSTPSGGADGDVWIQYA